MDVHLIEIDLRLGESTSPVLGVDPLPSPPALWSSRSGGLSDTPDMTPLYSHYCLHDRQNALL